MAKTFIYALKDPRNSDIRYVGKSNYPERRFWQHLNMGQNVTKTAWIDELAALGLKPELVILEEVDTAAWQDTERRWIAKGRQEGWPLTNVSDGGEGLTTGKARGKQFDFFIPYVLPDLWESFESLAKKRKKVICRAVALAIMNHSWIAIKARGGNPKMEFSTDVQFSAGQAMANRLVKAAANESQFVDLLSKVDTKATELIALVEAVVN
ncbi:MAG: GIY-YIG nuclease family protein [Phycisphaerales bacterium]|jgi:hypothetical protein